MSTTDGTGTPPKERIHFVEVDMQNLMRIRRVKVFLRERGVVPVSGKNKAGKTGFLRGLKALVGGAGQVEEDPRNRDAPEAEPSYTLSKMSNGMTLKRDITGAASAPKGNWSGKDVKGRSLTAKHLAEMIGSRALDPLSFFGKQPREQRDILLGFAPLLRDSLAELAIEKEQVEEKRRPHNSEVTRLNKVSKPDGVRPDPIDVAGEMGRLTGLESQVEVREKAADKVGRTERGGKAAEVLLTEARDEIASLAEKLRGWEEKKVAYEESVAALTEELRAAQEAHEALPDVTEAIAAVKAHIAQADSVAVDLEPWKAWDKAQTEIGGHRVEARRLTDILNGIDQRKREATQDANLPFTDLTFDDDGEILIDGERLSAVSGKELATLALEVAIADDPDLGVVFMSGNELDDEALAATDELAEEHDFQVIMDIIHSPGMEGEVRMVDGVAHQDEPQL